MASSRVAKSIDNLRAFVRWSDKISPTLSNIAKSTLARVDSNIDGILAAAENTSAVTTADVTEVLRELDVGYSGRLEFGTAGLRGEMGPGLNRMNDVTVLQAAQGLVDYVVSEYGAEAAAAQGIVVGYDHRARTFEPDTAAKPTVSSHRFALLTAAAALARGVKVYLFDKLVCTPMVPYAIRHLNALAGVMVTASHNPKKDDGYKVYAANGAQIISPADKKIAKAIEANAEPWPQALPAYENVHSDADLAAFIAEITDKTDLCVNMTETLISAYIEAIKSSLCRRFEQNGSSPVNITYTAMHGVGTPFATAMFAAFGLPAFHKTAEQCDPDPEFPTVAFPNPEEGKGALELAMRTAERTKSTIILANDPDADRLAVAEWNPDAKEWKVFTGNEIGSLLAHWAWRCYRETGAAPENAVMLASTVSTKFIAAMAAKEGFTFQETLTGFKWMGNAMEQHEKAGKSVLFSFEEAIGFACGGVVRDKDGVSAAAVFAEMAGTLAREGKTVLQHLKWLYETYGFFASNNHYVFVDAPEKTLSIFARLRNEGHYWMRLGNLKITAIRDLTGVGWDSDAKDGVPSLPTSSGTQMITYKFCNGVTATLRTSGTEPKLKYYTELQGEQTELDRTVELIINEMIQPERYGLKRPTRG